MEQSLMQQMMMNQTQMVQQMRQMQTMQTQMQEEARREKAAPEPLPASAEKQPMANSTIQPQGTLDATQPRPFQTDIQAPPSTMAVMRNVAFDAMQTRSYLLGSEQLQQHESRVRQQMQMGALNAVGGVANTASSVGGFFLPGGLIASTGVGLGVGAAVGYGVDKAVDGAKDALRYQNILEKKGFRAFNVFEGRNDFGGIGMTLNQQQDISGFLRDLEPEKMINSTEMSKILDGALDGKLLKSTTDLKSFKEKFSSIVDTVKEVAVVMNGSLEEATKMLGELEARGISTGKATMMAAQAKVNASIMGIDQNKAFNGMLQTADAMTQGSGMSAAKAFNSAGAMQFVTSALYDGYKKDPNQLANYNYIKNNGGEEAIAASGTDLIQNGFTQYAAQYLPSQLGFAAMVGADGNVTLDMEKVRKMSAGGYGDAQAISELSNQTLQTLTNGQKEQFLNSVGEDAKQLLGDSDKAAIWRNFIDLESKRFGRTRESVLLSNGAAKDAIDAKIKIDQIYNTTDQATNEFASLSTREALAGIKRVNSPGAWQQTKSWWGRNVTNPLGDVGQGISDEVGDLTLSLQKSINNIDSKGMTRSDKLVRPEDFDEGVFSGEDSYAAQFNKSFSTVMQARSRRTDQPDVHKAALDAKMGGVPATSSAGDIKKQQKQQLEAYLYSGVGGAKEKGMSKEELEAFIYRADKGDLSLQELATVRQGIKDGTYGKDGVRRGMANHVLDVATGKKSVTDNEDYHEYINSKEVSVTPWDNEISTKMSANKSIKETQKDLKERMKDLSADKKDAIKSAMKRAGELDLTTDQAAQLQAAIASGNLDSVREVTSDKTLLKRMGKVDKLQKGLLEGANAADALSGIVDNTAARTDGAQAMVNLLVSSKALDKNTAQTIFSGALDQASKIDKGMKKGGWTLDQLAREEKMLQGTVQGAFAGLDEKQLLKYAEGVANLNENDAYTVDSFMKDGQIDRKLLAQASNAIIVDGSKKGQDTIKSGKTADEALGEHQDAMGKMLETLSKETSEMKKAVKKMKNGQVYQYTAVTGK